MVDYQNLHPPQITALPVSCNLIRRLSLLSSIFSSKPQRTFKVPRVLGNCTGDDCRRIYVNFAAVLFHFKSATQRSRRGPPIRSPTLCRLCRETLLIRPGLPGSGTLHAKVDAGISHKRPFATEKTPQVRSYPLFPRIGVLARSRRRHLSGTQQKLPLRLLCCILRYTCVVLTTTAHSRGQLSTHNGWSLPPSVHGHVGSVIAKTVLVHDASQDATLYANHPIHIAQQTQAKTTTYAITIFSGAQHSSKAYT